MSYSQDHPSLLLCKQLQDDGEHGKTKKFWKHGFLATVLLLGHVFSDQKQQCETLVMSLLRFKGETSHRFMIRMLNPQLMLLQWEVLHPIKGEAWYIAGNRFLRYYHCHLIPVIYLLVSCDVNRRSLTLILIAMILCPSAQNHVAMN